MKKISLLFILCVAMVSATNHLRQYRISPQGSLPPIESKGSSPHLQQSVTVAIGVQRRSLLELHEEQKPDPTVEGSPENNYDEQAMLDEDVQAVPEVNPYEEQQLEWEKQQQEIAKQSEIEKQMDDQKLQLEKAESMTLNPISDDFNEDIDSDIDVNAPNAYFFAAANTYSIVKLFGAAALDDPANHHDQPTQVANMMPIEKITIPATGAYQSSQDIQELHLDDSSIVNELLGSYTPAPSKVQDPTLMNSDLQYQVEEQIAKAIPQEEAKLLYKQYLSQETKLEEQHDSNEVEEVPHVALPAPEVVEQTQDVVTEILVPGDVAEQPDPILPFSHPEFSPDQYNYPTSEAPALPLQEFTGGSYVPEAYDQDRKAPEMKIDEVKIEAEMLQIGSKSIDQLLDEDDLFNAGPERFTQQ